MTIIDDPLALGTGGGGRIAVTFSPAASVTVRVMAARLRVSIPELVRRALGLFRVWMTLPKGSYLAIVHADGKTDRFLGPEHAGPTGD